MNHVKRPSFALRAALFVLLAAGGGADAMAQWKWVDASGGVHYSDQPPTNVPPRNILARPPAARTAAPASSAASGPALPPARTAPGAAELARKLQQQEKDRETAKSAQKDAALAIRLHNCEQARQELASLQTARPRMFASGPDGQRIALGDDEIEARRRQAQAAIDAFCR